MADTVMISSLGAAEIAAVGLVNQYVFFFIVATFGICSAGSVFFSQYYGYKDLPSVKRYLSISLQLSVILSIIFTVVSLLFPETIMRLLIPDDEVIALGIDYLKIISLTFIISAISQCFNTVLRSCDRAKEPLKVSIISFFVNVFFNYLFIFGSFGFPRLGVVGAAIGTLIARLVEVVLLTIMVFKEKEGRANLRPTELLKVHGDLLRPYLKVGIPIILSESLWSFGQLLFAVAYGRIGQEATAAIQLTNTIQNVFFIIVNATCTAAAVIVGQSLGANLKEQAKTWATYFLQMIMSLGLVSLLILVFLPDVLMMIFGTLEEGVYQTARNLLIIRGFFIPFRFLNGMLFIGIFRAGGETKLPFILELITMWGFAIPMSFIGVLLFNWPIEWVFTIVSVEELLKFLLIYPLYRKKRWLRTMTENN